jgi:hypothetical protein
MSGQDSDLELYPSEKNGAVILWADLQRKYGEKPNTKENLIQFANEAEDRFKRECGLVVEVDVSNMEQANNGDLVPSPIINILDRIEKQDFDFERAQFETRQGYADGRPGVITEDGRWREPDKKM